MVAATAAIEATLRRDRTVTLAALAAVAAAAWIYVLTGAGMDMPGTAPAPWTPGLFALMLAMWAVMMVAMMLPSAAPTILLFASVERRRGRAPGRGVAVFVLGYLGVWIGFSLAATILQWGMERLALLSPAMATTSTVMAAAVLVAAGLYQLTPLKRACLRRCRSPLDFLVRHWREGPFRTGLRHGLFCLGCCWVLMALLFVGGVMSPLWIGGIALIVMVEKLAPRGEALGRALGLLLVGCGLAVLAGAA